MCKKTPKPTNSAKTSVACWKSSMGWCTWYSLATFGQVAFAFSGLLSCNHLCLNGESLFSCFNVFLSKLKKTSQKLFSKIYHASPADYSQICSCVLRGRFETEILCCSSVPRMHPRLRLNLENERKTWLVLNVEKHNSAWIPVQDLEEGFKDEKISWFLYVISTPLQKAAQRGIIEGETAPGSSFHENPVKEKLLLLCCFSLDMQ